jgi:hypothetical protein
MLVPRALPVAGGAPPPPRDWYGFAGRQPLEDGPGAAGARIVEAEAMGAVWLGLGRIVALCYRSSTFYQMH